MTNRFYVANRAPLAADDESLRQGLEPLLRLLAP
jgi:hypothetical protein